MLHQVHSVLVHTMSDYELSRVRTELSKLPIVPFSSPHLVHQVGMILILRDVIKLEANPDPAPDDW
jgi:hypothetical protein